MASSARRSAAASASGGLTFERYLSVMTSVLSQSEEEGGEWTEVAQEVDGATRATLGEQFSELDSDSSGVVSIEELLVALKSAGNANAGAEHDDMEEDNAAGDGIDGGDIELVEEGGASSPSNARSSASAIVTEEKQQGGLAR